MFTIRIPDPSLFVTPTADQKKALFIETWLRIRDPWIAIIAHGGTQPMSSQFWHDFLAADLSGLQVKSDTRLAMRLQKIYNILSPAKSAPEVKPRSTVGDAFFLAREWIPFWCVASGGRGPPDSLGAL
jgi:hypothetical protein